MKLKAVIVIFLSLFFMGANLKKASLKIALTYLTKEKSKDSNTSNLKYTLYNGRLTCTSISQRSGKGKQVDSVQVSKKQVENLVSIIRKNKLLRNERQVPEMEFEAPYTTVLINCKIVLGGKGGNISIYLLSSQMEENKTCIQIQELKSVLTSLLK